MKDQTLRLFAPTPADDTDQKALPLGRYLVDAGVISGNQLVQALQMQLRLSAPLGEILVAEGWAKPGDILAALSLQHAIPLADLSQQAPDPHLSEMMHCKFWLQNRAIPWMRLGRTVLIATTRPDQFEMLRAGLGHSCPDVLPVLASNPQITAAIAHRFAKPLAKAAECRVAEQYSCRGWRAHKRLPLLIILVFLLGLAITWPQWTSAILSVVALVTLVLFSTLKLVGFGAHILSHNHLKAPRTKPEVTQVGTRRPKVSVLVPLYRETKIADALIRRLNRLSYPKALLDVILVLEEHDVLTRQTLADTRLPDWMRVIQVPAHNGLTTKPRAMNYALDFCQGDIVGVWDAEDAPAPDQIEKVVARFAEVPDDVVCLQGILDYYNPRTNWLARCFTIEYSSWFRIVLPGIARLGLWCRWGAQRRFSGAINWKSWAVGTLIM